MAATPKVALVFLRHGDTVLNRDGKFRGRLNVPLDEKGQTSAEAAADKLRGMGITRIISSGMDRAKQTAQIVADKLSVKDVTVDDRLSPLDVGVFQGHDRKANWTQFVRYLDNPHETIPSGEKVNDFRGRNSEFLNEVLPQAKENGPFLAIAHTSNITTAKDHGTNAPSRPEENEIVPPGGIAAIMSDGSFKVMGGAEAARTVPPARKRLLVHLTHRPFEKLGRLGAQHG